MAVKVGRCEVYKKPDLKIVNNIKDQKIHIDNIPQLSDIRNKIVRGDCIKCKSSDDNNDVLLMYLDPEVIQYSPSKGMASTNLYAINEFCPKYWSDVDVECIKGDRRIIAKMKNFSNDILQDLDDIVEPSKNYRTFIGVFMYDGKKYAYMHRFTEAYMKDENKVINMLDARLSSKQPEVYSYVTEDDLSSYMKKYFIKHKLTIENAIMATN